MATKRTIQFDTSISSMEKTKSELMEIQKNLDKISDKVLNVAVAEGKQRVQNNIRALGINSEGELYNNVETEIKDNVGSVYIDLGIVPHAEFVEYGTGVVGGGNPHPDPVDNWIYDVNSHGEKGWVYRNPYDGKFYRTRGMVHRPFMYNSYKEMEERIKEITKEVIEEW